MQEVRTIKVYPFSAIYRGENRRSLILPLVPMRVEQLTRQEVRFDNRLIWSKDYPWEFKQIGGARFYVNYDETAMFVEYEYRHESPIIVRFNPQQIVNVKIPEPLKAMENDYTYPLRYVRWDGTSAVIVATEPRAFEGSNQWSINPMTGDTSFLRRD